MKTGGTTYWLFGAMIAAVSLAVVAVGFLERRLPSRSDERVAIGAPLSDQQTIARRRGAIGTVAVAGATTP